MGQQDRILHNYQAVNFFGVGWRATAVKAIYFKQSIDVNDLHLQIKERLSWKRIIK